MKCVEMVGVKKLEVAKTEDPKLAGDDVVIEVSRGGICGSDIHYWDQGQPKGLVMGHEFSGVVLHTGNRKDLKIGDRVTALPISPCNECYACKSGNPQYCRKTWDKAVGLSLASSGAFAEKLVAKSDMVIKLPDSVSDEEGAMIEPAAVGLHGVNLADIQIGDKVLIVGGGIIGLVSAMFAKLNGASYVAVSETNPKRGKKAVEYQVADEWLDATDKKFVENAVSKTCGGFDKVVECCGAAPAVQSALLTVKPGGRVVLVGVSMAPIQFLSVVAVMSEIDVQGAIGYTKEEFETCINLVAQKKIDILKFLSKTVGLKKVQASFEELTSPKCNSIKILVDPKK